MTRLIETYIALYCLLGITSAFSCERCYEEIKDYHYHISKIEDKYLDTYSQYYLHGTIDTCEHFMEIYEMRHNNYSCDMVDLELLSSDFES